MQIEMILFQMRSLLYLFWGSADNEMNISWLNYYAIITIVFVCIRLRFHYI